MTNKERVRLIIGTAINIVVFVLEVICLCIFIKYVVQGNQDNRFRYFTNISNLTVGAFALPTTILLLMSIIKGKMIYPKYFHIAKFIALTMTSLTFVVVLFALAPLTSLYEMYSNVKFITHLVVPVIAVVSYLFFEDKTEFNWKWSLLGMVPSIIYSVMYGVNVALLKRWPDLYQVNNQGLWYLFSIATVVVAFGVAQGLYFLKRLTIKKAAK